MVVTMKKTLNIVIPMAGAGKRFQEANYTFPKPLIDVEGKPMIELVVDNLRPKGIDHKFIFICKQEHFEQYSLRQIFKNLTNDKYDVVLLRSLTEGAACTVLTAVDFINSENDLVIANSDQIIDTLMSSFVRFCRNSKADGTIMTFHASHPKWSYARTDKKGNVLEVAEKKVISEHATVGIYYFRTGKLFVENACSMIQKNIRVNNEFYVCPVYNEILLRGGTVNIWEIESSKMHGLGTPEDLNNYLRHIQQ
jgi:dTDP-glucose pyrophosphorylase